LGEEIRAQVSDDDIEGNTGPQHQTYHTVEEERERPRESGRKRERNSDISI
jgi:hypothetical protein